MKIFVFILFYSVYYIMNSTGEELTTGSAHANHGHSPSKYYDSIPQTESSYKLHQTLKTFNDAKTTCEQEGASLFYAETEKEWNDVMTHLQNKYKNSFPAVIYLGVQRSENNFESLYGIPVSNGYIKWGPNEPNNAGGSENCVVFVNNIMNDIACTHKFAFICKLSDWNEYFGMMSNLDYGYCEETGKFYKFHLTPRTWSEAQDKCRAEHSHLAVINSHEEAAYLVRLTRKTLRSIPGRFTRGVVLLGFHNNNVEDWQTVEGTSLYYSGYACWGNSQPDGGESDRCGSMFYNGHLNDIACDQKAFFICEHDNVALNYVREPRSFYNVIQSVQCHDTI